MIFAVAGICKKMDCFYNWNRDALELRFMDWLYL